MKKSDKKVKKLTYVSLFSGAGIGCYGFKKEGFECIATCESIAKRLEIQKFNKKCEYVRYNPIKDENEKIDFVDGYIDGAIGTFETDNKLMKAINLWKLEKGQDVDVIIATPPCQGMSVANQKKKDEINRNSLVVKAIKIIKKVEPKIFIFENVATFLKTECTGIDWKRRSIGDEINLVLSENYKIESEIINFKNYGNCSSRTRTLVIGVRKDYLDKITPFEILPDREKEKTLRETIGDFKRLKNWGEIDSNNILHSFKIYDERMRDWIKDLKEGQSAFDNKDPHKKPHVVDKDGKISFYTKGFGDKYKRQYWDKVAPCIHSVNGSLASQNTIHPEDDRVFSIAELMKLMTIPDDFKWDEKSVDELNQLNNDEKRKWLKQHENNIRMCIGEGVPTIIFWKMAKKIKEILVDKNGFYEKSLEFEKNNKRKKIDAAYFTSRINLAYIYDLLSNFKKKEINILEPSVGFGNFLIPLFKKYEEIEKVNLKVVDINPEVIGELKEFLKNKVPENFKIEFINKDFLECEFKEKFDLVVGNPPFKMLENKRNAFEMFWEKSLKVGEKVILVSPKYVLNGSRYRKFRDELGKEKITNIIDFGELGFRDAKIETIAIKVDKQYKHENEILVVKSIVQNRNYVHLKDYVIDKKFAFWLIYRSVQFDQLDAMLEKDLFKIKKNYELSNGMMEYTGGENKIRVLKSKNIDINNFNEIKTIAGYDRFVKKELVENSDFYKYLNDENKELFLVPTMTFYPRMIRKPKENLMVNGSIVVAELKDKNRKIDDDDLKFFYSKEFRDYYKVLFNDATRTLHIDKEIIKYFGVLKNKYKVFGWKFVK